MKELEKLKKGAKRQVEVVGSCPQGKGLVTFANSEKCQKCVIQSQSKRGTFKG